MNKVICPYCKKEAKWCENKEVYGQNYGESYMCYHCKKCGAYVGCHENSRRALGSLANKELRDWRKKAHLIVDQHWQFGKHTRKEVYAILKEAFGKDVHIAETRTWTECAEIIKRTIEIFNQDSKIEL